MCIRDRIQSECGKTLPMLPVNNIVLIGATDRQNKTIRKQVSLSVVSRDIPLDTEFLIATGLPFDVLLGCDILRRYSAVIDLNLDRVSLFPDGITWTANLVGGANILPSPIHQQLRKINIIMNSPLNKPIIYNHGGCLLYTSLAHN